MKINKISITKIKNINIYQCYKILFKVIFFIVLIYLIGGAIEKAVSANVLNIMGGPESFNELSGPGKYLGEPYRFNYYLDAIDGSYMEQGINFIANFFWDIDVIITYALLLAFNLAFSTDIASLFSGILDSIMSNLKNNIFDTYILLTVSIGLLYVIASLFKRNVAQVLSRIGYMVFAVALATVIVAYSGKVVTVVTQMSKEIGASSIVSVTNDQATQFNISQISGEIWGTLVHQPWLELEAESKLSSSEVESILSLDRDSKNREEKIKSINDGDKSIFAGGVGKSRVVPAMFMLFVNGFKIAIMLVIAMIQIVFQIMTIILIIFLFIILLLSVIPSYGPRLLGIWGRQVLGFQTGIVLTSMILGFLIKCDNLIATSIGGGGTYGWLIVTFFQVCIYGGIIYFRSQIFDILKKIQNTYTTTYATQLAQNGVESIMNAPGSIKQGINKLDEIFGSGKKSTNDGQSNKNSPDLDFDENEDNDEANATTSEEHQDKYESSEDAPELNIDYEDGDIVDVEYEELGREYEDINKPIVLGVQSGNVIDIGNKGESKKAIEDAYSESKGKGNEVIADKDSNVRKIDNSKEFIDMSGKNSVEKSKDNQLDINKEYIDNTYDKQLYGKNGGIEERPTLNIDSSGDVPREIPSNKEYTRGSTLGKSVGDIEKSAGDIIKKEIPHIINTGEYVKREDNIRQGISNIDSTYDGETQIQEIEFDKEIVGEKVKGNSRFEEVLKQDQDQGQHESKPEPNYNIENRNVKEAKKIKKISNVNGNIDSIETNDEYNSNDTKTSNINDVNIPRNKEIKTKEITNEDRGKMFSSETI